MKKLYIVLIVIVVTCCFFSLDSADARRRSGPIIIEKFSKVVLTLNEHQHFTTYGPFEDGGDFVIQNTGNYPVEFLYTTSNSTPVFKSRCTTVNPHEEATVHLNVFVTHSIRLTSLAPGEKRTFLKYFSYRQPGKECKATVTLHGEIVY